MSDFLHRWDFTGNNDDEGWIVSPTARCTVVGGAMWLQLANHETQRGTVADYRFQVWGDTTQVGEDVPSGPQIEIASPRGLGVQVGLDSGVLVAIRLLNLSPATELLVRWRTREQIGSWAGQNHEAVAGGTGSQSRRVSLQPDLKEWQNVTCHIDPTWRGEIDQVAVYLPVAVRGDVWIDSIILNRCEPEPTHARPDLCSANVIPRVTIPGISHAGFADAFQVLDDCLIEAAPIHGFPCPVIAPGGRYLPYGWWELDSSLALAGSKWVSQPFAEDVLHGFKVVQAQNPDGRIDLWGRAPLRGQVADQSALPALFEIAYDVARRSADATVHAEIFTTMSRYLEWWLSPVKRHADTGLVCGVFEETFPPAVPDPPEGVPGGTEPPVAPVDLNVAVAIGAKFTADLAAVVGRPDEERRHRRAFNELVAAVNEFLWDEADGAYYNYDLRENRRRRRLLVSTFDPLRLAIAPKERRDRLLERLTDASQFGWGKLPLTSLAMTDADYIEATGPYDGRAWFGNVWTIRNMTVVHGLEESGCPDLAAELNWATIKAFHANYHEFLDPSGGQGHGVERYAWSASQYIEAIIEHLFGVQFDAVESRLLVKPHIPRELFGESLVLDHLCLPTPGETRVSVRICQESPTDGTISVRFAGQLPKTLHVSLTTQTRALEVTPDELVEVKFPFP